MVQKKAKNHIKAFASELLTAVVHLACLMKMVTQEAGVLLREQYLLEMARLIFKALLSGNEVLRDGCRRLAQSMPIHHEEFMEVLPECAKPKLHTNRHTTDAMIRHQVDLSCMAADRTQGCQATLGEPELWIRRDRVEGGACDYG